jgi:hypothetical protein
MKIIFIKNYEMICKSRWGLHIFRNKKTNKINGFRILGIGLSW